MKHFLALETATDVCSTVVFTDGKPVAERRQEEPKSHAAQLVPMVNECLAECSLKLHDMGAVAVSSGPGSYTGLRIGVSTAKGFAFACDSKIVSVPTLEAMAFPIVHEVGGAVVAMIPSRKVEVFMAVFSVDKSGNLKRLLNECVVPISEIQSRLDEADVSACTVTGPGLRLVVDEAIQAENWRLADVPVSAVNVGYCAVPRLEHKIFEDTSSFEPYYLREFIARHPARPIFDRLPF